MKFLVSVGSYERIVFGFDVELNKDLTVKKIKDSFAMPAHIGSVRSIASCPKFLVSGSADETLRIFDLKRRKELGTMVEHNGTINALEFFGQSHLLTASDDGKVALFRTSDWECLHVLLHKAPISDLAVHPSGKLAISVSARDKSLRLWNLVTGKQASKAKTPKPVNKAVWSRTGRYYALLADNRVFLYDAENAASFVAEIPSTSRLLTATFFNDSHLLFAGEGSVLHCWDIEAGAERTLTLGQKPRIKDMTTLYSDQADLLITVASEGSVCIWDMAKIITPDTSDEDGIFRNFIAKHSIKGLRPICMTACLQ